MARRPRGVKCLVDWRGAKMKKIVIATKNKGQIMKTIMPELKGKADGKVINEVVTEMCNA